MTRNVILDELYAARDQLLADAGGDVKKYLEQVRARERASGRLLSAQDMEELRVERTDSSAPTQPARRSPLNK